MIAEIKVSKLFHHGRAKQEFKLCGYIELFIDDKFVRKRHFSCPKERMEIINLWHRISPALRNSYHYFIIKYDYL